MCKVSVIMPSLNMVGYIEDSVSSVLSQTLTDIEVICVDAGSDDGTIEILNRLAVGDPRIRVIKADKKSYGYQMNLGIRMATGEYIGIVETDDYIEPDMYEMLYARASENNLDIVKSDYDMFFTSEDGIDLSVKYSLGKNNNVEYGKVYSAKEYLSGRYKLEIYIWNAIYRKTFLLKNNVQFNETPGASFQDFSFRYQTCFFADRIMAIDKAFYHYRRDNANASTYNPRTVEFNERESEYILNMLNARGDLGDEIYEAIAREIVEFASWPYIDMVKWVKPAESTEEAFDKYRRMLGEFMEEGRLTRKKINNPFLWQDLNLLMEGSTFFMKYAAVIARLTLDEALRQISEYSEYENLVIFGTGNVGKAIYVFLSNCGIPARVFCDNNPEKVGDTIFEVPVVTPAEAVTRYPDAMFIISSLRAENEMSSQLRLLGVNEENITTYSMQTDAAFCTNCMIREILKSRGIERKI